MVDPKSPRIAIFHNYMDNIGGAEKVVLTLAQQLHGDLYSTVANQDTICRMGYDVKVKTIGWIPTNPPLRQQAALARFRHLNVADKYDHFIIGGDWAVSAAIKHRPNLWYVHSPIREIWDLYEYTRAHNVPQWQRPIFDAWVAYNRRLNLKYVRHADRIACNSINTQQRILTYLKREATVIYPPIDTSKYSHKPAGDYWLSVNRLISHKRVELQMKAFARLPHEKLIVVGCYEQADHFQKYARHIMDIKPDNVTLLKSVPEDQLRELYANCKGFITTSHNEDFGMTVVEAMASGKPVIAPNEGGYKETVIDGVTGLLINGIDEHKLVDAIQRTGASPDSYRKACQRQAATFDTSVFIRKIRQELHS